jgi:putative transposon-encoded protein
MKIVPLELKTKLNVEGIRGFIKRKVTPFGTSAKVDCPKEYLGHDVYLVILENGTKKESKKPRGSFEDSTSKNRRAR